MMKLLILIPTLMFFSTKNPIKLSAQILILSVSMFILMWKQSSSSWISLVMTLLFTGGILVMFMILATFHPNESPSKMKINIFLTLIMIFFLMCSNNDSSWKFQETAINMKVFYQSNFTMILSTLIILLYFSMFILIMKKEENSMRMILCRESSSDL